MSKFFTYEKLDSEIDNIKAVEITFNCTTENCDGEVLLISAEACIIGGVCSKCGNKYKFILKNRIKGDK